MKRYLQHLATVYNLGIKEFYSLSRDMALMVLIIFMFSGAIYLDARAKPDSLHKATIAVVDEDRSQLSSRLIDALHEPYFLPPRLISRADIDSGMDAGQDTFVLNIPPSFERDVIAGKAPALQLNADATRQSQALVGSAYIQNILGAEIARYVQPSLRIAHQAPVNVVQRVLFNPNLYSSWFGSITGMINNITLLSIILTGAAVIREREHGTIEHLLVMPVTPLEIMLSKVWSMGVVVLLASVFSLQVVIKGIVGVTVTGSATLFALGTIVYLFATTSIGIYMGTLARTMPQFGLMAILILLPLQILSGAVTPRESLPDVIQWIMSATPTLHFVSFAQAVLLRGAGFLIVAPQLVVIAAIGLVFFLLAHNRLRKTMGSMG